MMCVLASADKFNSFFIFLFVSVLKAGLEQVWALKAIKYAETHFKVCSIDGHPNL